MSDQPDRFQEELAKLGAQFELPEELLTGAQASLMTFQSYMQTGEFTPAQALYLTAVVMTGNPGIPPRF